MPDLSFASSLVGDESHHFLVNLGEGEIKTIENLKAYATKQLHIIEQYVNGIQKLNSSSDITKFGLDEDSPFVKIWKVFYSECIQVTALFSQLASNYTTSFIPRLEKLLTHMKEAHKQYKNHRFRIDSELKTVCDQESRLRATYKQHAEEVENAKQKLEGQKAKADKTKQDKFKKASLKLYQNHNEYVLALSAATTHQTHYESGILPNLLNSLQNVKQDLVAEWKSIMNELTQHLKECSEQYARFSDAITSTIEEISDENPYEPFIVNKGVAYEPQTCYKFDETLLNITKTDLQENEIALNDLTIEQLKSKNTLLEKTVTETKTELNEKSSEYQTSKQMLLQVKESSSSNLSNLFVKQMAVSELSRELKELSCTNEKALAQREIISYALENGDPQLRWSDLQLSNSLESCDTPDATSKPGRTLQRLNKLFSKPIPPPKKDTPYNGANNHDWNPGPSPDGMNSHNRPLPVTPVDTGPDDDTDDDPADYDEPVEVPLYDELWYHGTISRVDAEALLKDEGDYLVRESNKKPGNYVLSARWGTVRHFIIQQDESGKFRLEGESYSTVTHLVDFHKKHQCAVTRKSSAILKNPILRPKSIGRNLNHDNIVIESKLGRGHFGDVMKGRLQDSREEVAVKTCRDNVIETIKAKFLQEAEILAQYDHPNIVKLIGIATDQDPVYIVMELMSGGDFLNHLRKNGSGILPKELLQYGIDAAKGMDYLESKGCIHRDLAARNCLLNKMNVLKISDFGMSRETDFYECSNMREIPVKWTAPEALNFTQYTSASDVWSFGVLLWETYSLGNTPYPGMGNKETREQVDRGYRMPPPMGTPASIYELMKECWQYEPRNRPQFRTVLAKLQQIKLIG
ncbi:tyrosine-protein kinase Fer-like [Dendronephthya gigantea]|uniref:tyrosine-protein kinase Fer-like n=1 Tax=Dendronephthya gigantea TaxID=151771 RepID=UPI00106DB91A|nr:tyrosine-protein kinase Fer-like [Dendronephthya gigantea]